MEVHHHSHTARKKWNHYFWEFLMLFLAVFCGFLAEYQLEHKIEKDRERQYMKGLLEDLAADTVMMNNTMDFAVQISKGLDSLQTNLFNADNVASNSFTIYRQNFTYIRLIVVSFSDQTATQLRNSGTLRLIKKTEIANAISGYWRGINSIEHTATILEDQFNEISKAGFNLFNRSNITAVDSFNRSKRSGTIPVASRQTLRIPNIRPEATLLTTDKFVLY
ncbi:MAG TPA: hypothetical protein V6C58_04205, partial [Allocoleopsis sp.]